MAEVKALDPYEYVGVVAPGAVVAVALFAVWPQAKEALLTKDLSLGEFGVFLVCAFVLGHIVQAVGSMLEWLIFKPTGIPTDWLRRSKTALISASQRLRLDEKLKVQQGADFSIESTSEDDWYAITREIYASISGADRAKRVDAFNRTYGLMRGITAALIGATIWFLVTRWSQWAWPATTAALAVLALFRMVQFAILYARELFVQYVNCQPEVAQPK